MRRLLLAMGLLISAQQAVAGNAEIVQVSPGVHMAIVKSRAGIFGQESSIKRKAIEAANQFAQRQNMQAVPVDLDFRPASGPGQWPVAEYQFRLVPPGSADAVALVPAPDVTIEMTSRPKTDSPSNPPSDLYSELIKLDDLRKRGLLTDQEFEQQKSRLLSR